MEHIFLRCEEKFSRSQMQKPEQNTRFSALKYSEYFFQISVRCWGVRKTPGFVICAKTGKNKWSSDETYIFSADRHLCLFHWRARFRNLGTRKMINQSGKSPPCLFNGGRQWWLDMVRKAWWGYRSIWAQLQWTFVLCGSRRAKKKIQLQELEITKMEVSPFLVV